MRPRGFDVLNLSGVGGREYDSSLSHRHTFYELFIFVEGGGIHEIDFKKHTVKKNSVHFVSPGQIHQLSLKKAKGYVLCFTEDLISLKKNESVKNKLPFYDDLVNPVLQADTEFCLDLQFLIKSLLSELGKNPENTELFRSYLNIILLKVKELFISQIADTPEKPGNNKVGLFKQLINEHYLSRWHLKDYASRLSISPNYLNALCKKQEGRTAIALIQERLLLESKRMLFATDLTIKEIAYTLHFDDVPYFNRFFKNKTGLTPLSYRTKSN